MVFTAAAYVAIDVEKTAKIGRHCQIAKMFAQTHLMLEHACKLESACPEAKQGISLAYHRLAKLGVKSTRSKAVR